MSTEAPPLWPQVGTKWAHKKPNRRWGHKRYTVTKAPGKDGMLRYKADDTWQTSTCHVDWFLETYGPA